MEKLVITAALTGAETTRSQNPSLPITPDEMAEEAAACCQAGASVVHIHARDPESGNPTSSLDVFAEIAGKIKQKCDAIVNFTTGGAIWMKDAERIAVVGRLKPELASLDMGTMNFYVPGYPETWGDEGVFKNTFESIEFFAKTMAESETRAECEVYDVSMIESVRMMVERGVLESPVHLQFVMGVIGGIPAGAGNLTYLARTAKEALPGCTWSVCATGRHEFPMAAVAIVEGGHVRVGLEDNIYVSKGVLAKGNADLVAKVTRLAHELGREISTPEETRRFLKLKGSDKTNF
jgi:uncharacterized protein (DUF849 family)